MSYINVYIEASRSTQKIYFPNGLELRGEDGRQFTLRRAIKAGGNGVVFEADCHGPGGEDEGLCAVKLLKQLDEVRQDRFDNEIRILEDLNHPHITKVFGYGRERLGTQHIDVPWMAMSLGDANLRSYLDEHKSPLGAASAVQVGIQVCDAVHHFHQKNIIHRDLKPANIVWKTDEDRENVFLIDFGIAKYIGEDVSGRRMDDLTTAYEFVGPANFASPELLAYARDKTHPVDLRSDLFQIGLILWFLATNEVVAGIPSKKRDPTDGRLHDLVVTKLLPMDPDDRLSSASELRDELQNLIQ